MIRKFILCLLFFGLSPWVLGVSILLLVPSAVVLGEATEEKFSVNTFASAVFNKDYLLTTGLKAQNSTPVIIENYLKRYQSPLFPYRQTILEAAREFGVSPLLIVAIAQQESNLGKKSPPECYNAWGWGIHERGTKCFNDWNEAIRAVTGGIARSYCQKGLCDDPCEMMKKYTPQSKGSWCAGVNQFLREMETGEF